MRGQKDPSVAGSQGRAPVRRKPLEISTRKTRIIILSLAALGLTGCVSQNAAKKFAEFEKLGITEATIVGKFSSTEYKVEHADGNRKATLEHSNAWLPRVKIVRETKEE